MNDGTLIVQTELKVCDDIKHRDGSAFIVAIAPNKRFALICDHEHGAGIEHPRRVSMSDALLARQKWLEEEEGFAPVETEECK